MLNHMRGTTKKITDLQPGSVSRTLVEAPAVEIEELYLQMFSGLRDAIPVATFRSFGFGKLPAAFARGTVSVSNDTPPTAPIPIPTGTVFTAADGRAYLSTKDVTWLAGASSVKIPVTAAAAGLAYNIAAGGIVASEFFDASYNISNSAITTGRDIESDSEREARFAKYVGSLSRGTIFACQSAAESAVLQDEDGNLTEYVTRSGLTEIAGYVRIFIYSSAGVPSAALVTYAQQIIDGWVDATTGEIIPGYRAGGVKVDVTGMVETPVPLSVVVGTQPNYELDETMIQNINDAYSSLLASVQAGSVLYVDDIQTTILGVAGVKSVLIDATQNITCGANEVLVPGTVTVTRL